MAEFDELGQEAFLERYGFAQSARYVLVYEDPDTGETRRYDSKAIFGVAHGYEHGRALKASEFSGGRATVQRALEDLGFTVIDTQEKLPRWIDEEMILALDVYLRHRGHRLGKRHPEVQLLSDRLRALAPLRGVTLGSRFRNPAGIEQQLGKFLELDPTAPVSGRGDPSALHRQIWERYLDDPQGLRRRVAEILSRLDTLRAGPEAPPRSDDANARAVPRPRARVSRRELLAPFTREPPTPVRASAPMEVDPAAHDRARRIHERTREQLAEHLARHDLRLGQGAQEHRRELLFDLGVEHGTCTWIFEVKSLPETGDQHARLRAGLGQLLWYRSRWRRRCIDPCIGVLCVDRRPREHEVWREVCHDARVLLTWPERFSSLLSECLALERRINPDAPADGP